MTSTRLMLGRRQLIAGAAALAIVRPPASAAQFEWKAGNAQTLDNPQHVRQVELWEEVARETNGRLVVRVFPNSQLGGQASMLSQLRLGAIQWLAIGNSAYSEVVPAAAVDSVGFAFKNSQAAGVAMQGPLGDYVRKEFAAKGFYVPKDVFFELGMRQMTSSSKPIRSVDDFAGMKIRVPQSAVVADLFRTLGASPVSLDQSEVYTSLQTHLVDAQETPYVTTLTFRLYEVQRYLSVTNHMWTGGWYVANGDAWKTLPPDIQATVERVGRKYAALERQDAQRLNGAYSDKLKRLGMKFAEADTAGMRAKLTPYYARWKRELGTPLWSLLEATTGKLG